MFKHWRGNDTCRSSPHDRFICMELKYTPIYLTHTCFTVMFSFVTLQKRKLHRKEWWTYFLSFIEEFIYFLKHSKPFLTGQLTFYKYMSDPDEHRGMVLIRLLGNLNRPHSESVIFIFNNFWTFLTGFSNKKKIMLKTNYV